MKVKTNQVVKTVDFDKIQLVTINNNVVMTTGKHSEKYFEGIIIKSAEEGDTVAFYAEKIDKKGYVIYPNEITLIND